jgi:1-acyl-sn-glycerol-3-phosphate acyltransferase
MQFLLAPLRVLLLFLHILDGIAISGLLFPALDIRRRNRIIGAWSRGLVRICGARLRVSGVARDLQLARDGLLAGSHGRLVLCNHISWIDVFALLGAMPSRFVAKSEIGTWPLIGWLVTLVGTMYIERGRRHAVAAMNHRVRDRLRAGETIVVFAEGTTTDGLSLLPFHSNLIAPAIEVGCEIWPTALRYTSRGTQTTAAAFVGEMGLVTSLWNLLVAPDVEIEVAYLAPVAAAPDRTRHELASRARDAIASHLGFEIEAGRGAPATPPPAVPPADTAPERPSAPANASP